MPHLKEHGITGHLYIDTMKLEYFPFINAMNDTWDGGFEWLLNFTAPNQVQAFIKKEDQIKFVSIWLILESIFYLKDFGRYYTTQISNDSYYKIMSTQNITHKIQQCKFHGKIAIEDNLKKSGVLQIQRAFNLNSPDGQFMAHQMIAQQKEKSVSELKNSLREWPFCTFANKPCELVWENNSWAIWKCNCGQ